MRPSNPLLTEVKSWPIEAREEDNNRYFYYFNEVAALEKGDKSFVIGRKGTGKTAIAEYLYARNSREQLAQKLTFKNFPFNSLYHLTDPKYVRPNEYISVWKYVIYCCICKMMASNDKINYDARSKLQQIFDVDIENALAKSISKLTDRSFSLKVMGSGIDVGGLNDKKT